MTEIPLGILVIGGFLGLVAWLVMTFRMETARYLIAFMLFTAANGVRMTDGGGVGNLGWMTPFQLIRSDVFLACGALLGLACLTNMHKLGGVRISMAAWFLITIGAFQALMRIPHEGAPAGIISGVFTFVTLVPLAVMISGLTRTREDCIALIRIIGIANIAYIACCFISLFLSPDSIVMTHERRFSGLASQPITASITLGVSCVVALWLVLNDPMWRFRWVWISLIGLNGVLVLATGSRTGLLLLAFGGAAVLYRRLGKVVLLAPIGAISVVGAIWVMDKLFGLNFAFDRVTSLDDTRTAAWWILIDEGMSSPLIGIGTGAHTSGGTSFSENSYLYGFASFGIGMLALLLTFLFASMFYCLKLLRWSMDFPHWRPCVDFSLAIYVVYFALSPLDGGMLSRVDQLLVMLMLAGSISAFFLRGVAEGEITPLGDTVGGEDVTDDGFDALDEDGVPLEYDPGAGDYDSQDGTQWRPRHA